MKPISRAIYILNKFSWRFTNPLTLGVRVMLIKSSSVLLVKHTYQPEWYLPGGGVKNNETLEQAIRREAQEEVGASLAQLSLLGIYSNFYEGKSDHITVFICRDFSLSECLNGEIAEACFFDMKNLPPKTSPGTRRRVAEFLSMDANTIVSRW